MMEDFDFPIETRMTLRPQWQPKHFRNALDLIKEPLEPSDIHANIRERRAHKRLHDFHYNGKAARRRQAIADGHILANRRVRVADLPPGLIPTHLIEGLEQNQKIASCCRHPENHHIAAFYSSRDWMEKRRPDGYHEPWGGVPDIYIFYCTCGRRHPRFLAGQGDFRPVWGQERDDARTLSS